MKILNKNKKMKYSKMFIDYDTYAKICQEKGTTLSEHLTRMEICENTGKTPEMLDVQIAYEVFTRVTKIIRKRRVRCKKMSRS